MSEILFLLLLGIHLEAELLDHMAILFTILRNGHTVLFNGTLAETEMLKKLGTAVFLPLSPERCFQGVGLPGRVVVLYSLEKQDSPAIQNELCTRHWTWGCSLPCLSTNFCKVG